jgi:hypothetical protein
MPQPTRPFPSNDLTILAYLHCGLCIAEWNEKNKIGAVGSPVESPASYARLSVGWTDIGLQVWCNRHNCNVINVDFQGTKHPANTSRKP